MLGKIATQTAVKVDCFAVVEYSYLFKPQRAFLVSQMTPLCHHVSLVL